MTNNCLKDRQSYISLFIIFSFILLLFLNFSWAEEQEKKYEKEEILTLYEKLKKLEIDTTKAARLEQFSLKKDIFEWKFESGYLYLTKPIPEFPHAGGALFIGKGRMIFDPPNKIEREELKRYTDRERFNEPFKTAFLRFNDETRKIFEPWMQPIGNGSNEASREFEKHQKILEKLYFNLEFPVIMDYLSNMVLDPYLFIVCNIEDIGMIALLHSPANVEENLLFTLKSLGFGAYGYGNIISQFNKKEDYEMGIDLDYEDKDLIKINHYDMNFTIEPGSLLMDAHVGIHFQPLIDHLSVAQFSLMWEPDRPKMITELKLTDDQERELPFIFKNGSVLVQLFKTYHKGEKAYVRFDYKADFIRPDAPFDVEKVPQEYRFLLRSLEFLPSGESTFTLLNTYPWFPQYGYLKRYTFDLSIRVPKPFIAVGSGKTIRRWKEKKYNGLQSKEETPVALASILFGKYYTITDDSKRPVIHVHSLFKQQKQAKPMLREARTIVDLYEEKLGPFPYDELDVAQMGFFYGFGQAPPGLVQLTGEAFLADNEMQALPWITGKAGFRAGFLSHEIGHEWWGHVISWRNYHEQWLSESFTEYLAGLYVEATKGIKEFEYKLNLWKKWAFDKKDYGPIWLGGRLQRGFIAALYNKGPYVLHMLRMAFIIASKGPEEGNRLFFECLRNFCTEFRNQNATTKDFQKIIKKTARIDMDWFFDQWFRDSGIPKLRFSYHVRQTEDGKYLVEGKVWQEDKDHFKSLIIPIFVHFSDDQILPLKPRFMTKPELIVKVKLPKKPELLTIDDRGDLLAEIIYD